MVPAMMMATRTRRCRNRVVLVGVFAALYGVGVSAEM